MIGIVTMVYALAILLLVVGAVCFFFGVRFLQSSRKIKKKTMLQMKKLDKDVQNKYNRIALLSIGEFDNYMTKVFSMCMELASAESISDKGCSCKTVCKNIGASDYISWSRDNPSIGLFLWKRLSRTVVRVKIQYAEQ